MPPPRIARAIESSGCAAGRKRLRRVGMWLLALGLVGGIGAMAQTGAGHAAPRTARRIGGAARSGSTGLTALVTARRVALLLLSSRSRTDPEIAPLLKAARAAQGRKRSLFGLGESGTAPEDNPPPKSSRAGKIPQKNRQESAEAIANVPLGTLRATAAILFAEALAARLHSDLNLTITAEDALQSALAALKLEPTEAATPEGARRLCAHLDCQALLIIRLDDLSVRERTTRDVTLWADIRVPGGVFRDKATQRSESAGAALPQAFMVGSTASSDHRLFSERYVQTRLALAADAARQAAGLALHTLRTGEIGPFMQPGTRVALPPTPGPRRIDKLVFTAKGRYAAPMMMPDFGSALTFLPDLQPVAPQDILGPETIRRALSAMHAPLSPLWRDEDRPDIARAQALGRRFGADYVLLAWVPSLEMSEGPLDSTEPVLNQGKSVSPTRAALIERQALVEAVGALVRVRDGALLWHDRATATMSARSLLNGRPIRLRTEAEVARDAARFALLQLQREFERYRAGFAN